MEYELKFKINNKKNILSKLKKLDAVDLGRQKEIDIYLGIGNKGVRLRKLGKSGLATYKYLVESKTNAKVRKEIQTQVSDIDNLIEILKILGFCEKKRKEKIRHTFRLGNALILVDLLPFMGYFVEIEATSGAALKKAAQKLGFDAGKGNCDSYDNMFFKYYILNASRFKNSKTVILPTFKSEKDFKNHDKKASCFS